MLRSPRDAEAYRRTVEQTAEEATRLGELVSQLLTLSRHDAGQVPIFEETVRVDLLLPGRPGTVREPGAGTERRLSSCGPLPAWLVVGDDLLLSQLFLQPDRQRPQVHASRRVGPHLGHVYGTDLVVGVQDTGVGIRDDLLPVSSTGSIASIRRWGANGAGRGWGWRSAGRSPRCIAAGSK